MTPKKQLNLSIVIPAFNAASWLESTTQKIAAALERAPLFTAELIIVNDGSSDETSKVAHALKSKNLKITVIDQPNQGRFLARKVGVEAAKGDYIFFVDSRVFLQPNSLAFLADQLQNHPERKVWNGHIIVEKRGNIIAHFGDAITFIGWRRYFHKPKLISYGLEDFDYYPKGTGCFFVKKDLLHWATKEFLKESHDLRYSSDDTLLIRLIASKERINLSPDFAAIYHARTKIRQFIKHTYNRGKFFVDGFLRPGTRFYYPLIGVLVMSVVAPILLVIFPALILPTLVAGALLWTAELLGAIVLGAPVKDSFSLFLLSPLFALMYGLGIWRATIKKLTGV